MLEQILTELSRELSGVLAKNNVARLAAHHRIQGSPGFLDALNEVKETIERMQVSCTVHRYPADGKEKTFSWTAPLAWSVRGGSLRELCPQDQVLIRFDEMPHGVIAQSHGGAAEGELVDVGEGTSSEDYEGRDVAGKFVMATGKPQEVAPHAVERGATGVILYPTPKRAGAWPDLVQYAGFWPEAAQIEQTPLGFSISRRQADALLVNLREGPVRLAGTIDANLSPGFLHVLEAWIPGSNPRAREILLIAHLCHPTPSANDNASGSGLLLEIARVLTQLVRDKKIVFERTVRFLWVPEFSGTLPWASEHREQIKNLLFVLNLDMVGQSPERLGEPFRIARVPETIPSFLNAWFEPLLMKIGADPRTIAPGGTRRPMHWQLTPPSGGSDHIVFSDPVFHVPAVMFGHDDPLHHTHLDDLDMVDPTELKRVGVLAAALALIPSLLSQEADRLAGWLLRYSVTVLHNAFDLALREKELAICDLFELARKLEETRATDFKRLLAEAAISWDDERHRRALLAACDALYPASSPNRQAPQRATTDPVRPTKAFAGPLPYSFLRTLAKEDRKFMEEEFSGPYGAVALEALNLSDGKRTMREIALRLSLEFDRYVSEKTVARAVKIFKQGGWVAA